MAEQQTSEREIRALESYADEHSSYRQGKTYFVDSKRADFLIGHRLAVDAAKPAAESQADATGARNNSNNGTQPATPAARRGR